MNAPNFCSERIGWWLFHKHDACIKSYSYVLSDHGYVPFSVITTLSFWRISYLQRIYYKEKLKCVLFPQLSLCITSNQNKYIIWMNMLSYIWKLVLVSSIIVLFRSLLVFLSLFIFIGNCTVWPPLIYGLWLLLWYLVAIVLPHLLQFTALDYSFGIFKHFFQLYAGRKYKW